ncbi:DeoR/GlpR family DNA-binding transcription regulator [Dongia rigui]|uniref:DeoR/GlpR family DNA-binding transcription regulator n=1 Tax=Dongia rigui TaxID=940149 RepID=A0ABU5DSA9_9PROT|nr:DeoR/GlpR family DNA-binding transcription regulator [Dongia rigui]MDY0870309.1 DeoR/GlpR family DNA-binding transcription regulator [Dongia rigui]
MAKDLEVLSDLRLNSRQARIMEVLRRDQLLAVTQLAEALDVSGETIRRDLRLLSAKGLVEKSHGNVRWRDRSEDQPLQRRMLDNMAAKQAIAAAIANEISDGESVFLDTGSTNTYVAQALKGRRNLTVVTNSASIAQHLSTGQGNKVYLAGGELRADDSAAFGPAAILFLQQFMVKTAIISASGLDISLGVMDDHLCEAEVSRSLVGHAERMIVGADHSKFGRRCLVAALGFDAVDLLVTDQRPTGPLAEALERNDVEILVVDPAA